MHMTGMLTILALHAHRAGRERDAELRGHEARAEARRRAAARSQSASGTVRSSPKLALRTADRA
jgi:hypothetical protein